MRSRGKIIDLTPRELRELLHQGKVRLLDVREPAEHHSEHIEGSELTPLSGFDPTCATGRDGGMPVLYCRSGARSSKAARRVLEASPGHDVHHLRGGIEAWKTSGGRVAARSGGPISLERQVRIAAGLLVAVGTLLGAFVHPALLVVPAFVGAGLALAGITDTCGMAMVLARLPYNQRVAAREA